MEGEIVVFIDAHCIVDDPKWIQKFVRLFRDPEVGAVVDTSDVSTIGVDYL